MTKITITARLGLSLWFVALIYIGWKAGFAAEDSTVVHHYLSGGERWHNRLNLYNGPHGFIYTPLFALFFSLIYQIPVLAADILWRLLLLSLYFISLCQLINLLIPKKELFWNALGFASLIALPIAFSSLRNGQFNLALSAGMLSITAYIMTKNFNKAALLLALIMALKPTFIVFFLLATVLYKQLWWRTSLSLLLLVLTPLFFGGINYGEQQYWNFITMTNEAMKIGMDSPNWASFFNILPQIAGIYVPELLQIITKLIIAAITFLYCAHKKNSFDDKTMGLLLLTLASCYHLLFNPRSVNTDFIIIGSVMAIWLVSAIYLWESKRDSIIIGSAAFLILNAYELSKLITPEHHSWVNPAVVFIFSIYALYSFNCNKKFITNT